MAVVSPGHSRETPILNQQPSVASRAFARARVAATAFALAWACAGFSQTIEHGNPLLETLSEHLGISTTQAGRAVGAVLAMCRGHLTAQDYAVITAAIPAGEQLAEAAKVQGVVTRPIDSKEDLAAVFDQLGIPHRAGEFRSGDARLARVPGRARRG